MKEVKIRVIGYILVEVEDDASSGEIGETSDKYLQKMVEKPEEMKEFIQSLYFDKDDYFEEE